MPQASLCGEARGAEGSSRDQEGRGWRYNSRVTKRYLVLVIGAQTVPGLRVVLSVPAAERE